MNEDVRASDTEREAVIERLQRALSQGRLNVAECDERIASAYVSTTRAELALLTRDLPGNLW
ncbi:hypothetical protein FHX42_000490 [Saccharopolyspora lacisalsi]|uniref:DUF1707 domain-containing protein n=1 Tax=Halosaccharopolyspora lacisalsi TaxID=1000566 RepID=A0A839DVF7_9PSEU|nr:DUF1707 domain-containing protein [Halosaccharopolyspora lacisalsi]MBA8823161.1 hypothetical protein [Halosaccharopolyspora lacisalsi]